jgi:predicted metal-dependent HD superfamily phosphohydrolase
VEEALRAAWARDAGSSRAAGEALDGLLARYQEPHRHYHTLKHVASVLEQVDTLVAAVPVEDPIAVRLAVWFHDAVYDPRASNNEAASADLAERVLTDIGTDPDRVVAVRGLVLVTVAHEPRTPADDAVLCDADLSVLAARPAVYAAYVTGVRAEYGHVTDAEWRQGRAAVIERFLARAAIFHTAPMASAEHRARANLSAELASLR